VQKDIEPSDWLNCLNQKRKREQPMKSKLITSILLFGVLFTILLPINISAMNTKIQNAKEIIVIIDGKQLKCQLIDGETLVPLRVFSEAAGFKVDWDDATGTVILTKGSTVFTLQIDDTAFKSINRTLYVGNPVNISGSLFVPIRQLCSAIGAEIVWDSGIRTTIVTTDPSNSNKPGFLFDPSEGYSKLFCSRTKDWYFSVPRECDNTVYQNETYSFNAGFEIEIKERKDPNFSIAEYVQNEFDQYTIVPEETERYTVIKDLQKVRIGGVDFYNGIVRVPDRRVVIPFVHLYYAYYNGVVFKISGTFPSENENVFLKAMLQSFQTKETKNDIETYVTNFISNPPSVLTDEYNAKMKANTDQYNAKMKEKEETQASYIESANNTNVFVNTTQVQFTLKPQYINGVTMLPMCEVLKALGATVTWNTETGTAIATKGSTVITLQANNPIMQKNDRTITLNIPPVVSEGQMMIHSSVIPLAFGDAVQTNSNKITITTDPSQAPYFLFASVGFPFLLCPTEKDWYLLFDNSLVNTYAQKGFFLFNDTKNKGTLQLKIEEIPDFDLKAYALLTCKEQSGVNYQMIQIDGVDYYSFLSQDTTYYFTYQNNHLFTFTYTYFSTSPISQNLAEVFISFCPISNQTEPFITNYLDDPEGALDTIAVS
jgi:Copper amine oxidase N-terminal domain.